MKKEIKYIRFKDGDSDRRWNEFWSIHTNPRIVVLVMNLANWFFEKYHKPLIVSAVHRTEAEQKKLYYPKSPPESPHYVKPKCRAVDISVINLSKDEIEAVELWVHAFHKRKDGLPTIMVHDVGYGKHIHLQVGD